VGQRRGMGIGGGVPYYVVEKDVATNTVVVGTGYDKELYGMSATLEDAVWLTEEPQEGKTYQASIRYRQTPQNVSIVREGKNYVLTFSEPQRAITSGQSAVLYDGDVVVGGGIVA
jgi:tRNA-uridine 2-sulfurtransferase